MYRVLWFVNTSTFRDQDLAFPAYLSKSGGYKITAIPLSEWEAGAVPVLTNDPVFPTTNYSIPEMEIDNSLLFREEEGRERLKKAAEASGIDLLIHPSPVDAVEGIKEECRFADLVIVNAGLSFHESEEESPSRFVMELLPEIECPVLVMPDDEQEIREIYFTYNGGYSSVFAIRQMIYLFPHFKRLPVTVLYVEEGKDRIPFERSLKEFLYSHFESVTIKLLRGDTASALMDELMAKKDIMVTFGAFGRNKMSRFFKHSNAEGILQVINIPAFITHP